MKMLLLYMASVASLFALPECTKNQSVPPSDSTPAGYFPNKVGYRWVYKVTDSLKNLTDTVTVIIAGTIQEPISGETLKIWQYKWPDHIDTAYVGTKGDTVRFYMETAKKLCGCYPYSNITKNWVITNEYIFSVLGEKWVPANFILGPFEFSSNTISNKIIFPYENITGANEIDSSFEIWKGTEIPNASSSINEVFAPGIGMIQQTLTEMSYLYHQHWELLFNNFSVKEVMQ